MPNIYDCEYHQITAAAVFRAEKKTGGVTLPKMLASDQLLPATGEIRKVEWRDIHWK